ncbi:protein FAR1-RELATED SEQUENCE 5-like isoform X3 [Ananas comosus]|nr:protein FAR1-RELATED SEQUENCE 5-like isoform X3 [Ananas comosus]
MSFSNEEEAYQFYNAYARKVGFSIRKSHTKRRSDKSLRHKLFVCSKEGQTIVEPTAKDHKSRANRREGCLARVGFTINRGNVWTIQKVILDHTHACASPTKRHMLRSQRKITPAQRVLIDQMNSAGIKPSRVCNFFQEAIGAENVGFTQMDNDNSVNGKRAKYLNGRDAQTLMEELEKKCNEDPSFFSSIQIHETGQVANFFWADGRSILDYAHFGDVVCFDPTFQTNKYDMSFAPILGVNNHKQTIIFGAALLCDETTESFIWFLQTFLKCMSNKHPITIFTNQCKGMCKAIATVLPNTKHRLCIWHIFQNANINLGHIISNHPKFSMALKDCIYEARSVKKLEEKWLAMLKDYDLEGDLWLENLYAIRERWSEVHCHESFCAEITSTQSCESLNNHLKNTFSKKLSLGEFMKEYERSIKRLREKELSEDFKSRQSKPIPFLTNVPILITAANAYTLTMFRDFEVECKKLAYSSCELLDSEGLLKTYRVCEFGSEDGGVVTFNLEDHSVSCSCRNFEYAGFLCSHALKILHENKIYDLQNRYILKRWTNYAKEGSTIACQPMDSMNGLETLPSLYTRVSRKALTIAVKSSACREALLYLEENLNKIEKGSEEIIQKARLNEYKEYS